MPYALTFELFGSNNEGKRPAGWKLPANRGGTGRRSALAVEEAQAEELGMGLAGGATGMAISGLGGRAAAARRSLQGFDCLGQFNPSNLHDYRETVAGRVIPSRLTRVPAESLFFNCLWPCQQYGRLTEDVIRYVCLQVGEQFSDSWGPHRSAQGHARDEQRHGGAGGRQGGGRGGAAAARAAQA